VTALLRNHLQQLLQVLQSGGESVFSSFVSSACDGSDAELLAFLRSNELWGGSGSIADQAGIEVPEFRREIEAALVCLGDAQVAANVLNSRTTMWVGAFRKWEQRAT
jgi:hypothetical protein